MDRLGPTAAIVTLGCKTNQFESQLMEQRLRAAGFSLIPFEAGAELVVVNTCTVTAATDAQSRNIIRRCRRLNPQCRIVVTGCYAQTRPELFVNLAGVVLVLGNEEKAALIEYLDAPGEDRVHVCDIRSECGPLDFSSSPMTERSRAYLQIQNGCDAFCTYCIIPYARGPSRSLPAEKTLALCQQLVAQGFSEIILTGIHIGCYGRDLCPSLNLFDLVRLIEKQGCVPRLRLGSIEPHEIPAELITTMASSPTLCPHFHIPMQSGDDAVLERMGRPYRRDFFRELIDRIHATVSDVAIGLDVMAGFPGETDEEFCKTFDLVEGLPISYLHVFPFSPRPGTPAASMSDQVPFSVARERAALLRRLGKRKQLKFMRQFKGKRLEVVVEGKEKGGRHRGLSENYLPVFFTGDGEQEKKIVSVDVSGVTEEGLEGKMA